MRSRLLLCAAFLILLPFSAPAQSGLWSSLHHSDPAVFAQNLRNAGFPDAVVGLLVSQEVGRRFADREQALQPSVQTAGAMRNFWTQERRDAWFTLRKEKNDVLRAALGTAPDVKASTDWVSANYPHLNREDRDMVRMVTEDYDQLVQNVVTASRGHFMEGDRETIEYLEAQRELDLRRVLNELEVVDYQIKRSRFGSYARHQLQYFEPTPEEMRTYYRVSVKHGLHVQVFSGNLGGRERSAAQRAVDEELERSWRPERFKALRYGRSPHYRRIRMLTDRLNRPAATAVAIFESLDRLMTDVRGLLPTTPPGMAGPERTATRPEPVLVEAGNPPRFLGPEERKAKAIELLEHHLGEVRNLLGEEGLNEYRTLNRDWMSRLESGTVVIITLLPP